jgi:DNA-binding response OmpR family regulator
MTPKTKRTTLRAIQKTILLVDDDSSVREMIGRLVAAEGYRVLSASNGAEAVEIAAANPIDLVLLDLNMPVQGGWETFEKLTSKDPLLAVIIITARPNQLFTSIGAGVGALLEKPLDFLILLKTISDLLKESADLRLERLAGFQTEFHYVPSTGKENRE